MRKRALQVAAACLASTLLLLGLWKTSFRVTGTAQPVPMADIIGNDWIVKGPDAEDKVIVIAKMAEENIDWVTNDLKE